MVEEKIEYRDGDVLLEGFYVYQDSAKDKPTILVFHDWSGKNNFAMDKAKALAKLGYIGFAVDMFGKNKLGKTKEEKSALIQPLVQNRNALIQRTQAALAAASSLDIVDTKQIAAIGFCFGGLCALDLARSGADIKAVISFHGLLNAPDPEPKQQIRAKILVLHGYDDPMVKPDQVNAFAQEMTKKKVDWEINMYGHTMHGFTNPEANDPNFGTVYSECVTKRAWIAMQNCFTETFKSS